MYKQGLLSKEEFDKAKSILLEIEKIDADQVQDHQKKKKRLRSERRWQRATRLRCVDWRMSPGAGRCTKWGKTH